ncbi:PKD domain-containing protein [Micromonospora noduli]|uniref:Glucosylceramidase n=1 Tax=Micromonospora noduli TaxID=709876 RepID=A0A328MYA2_9ACTN|nr:PKD domain-containing protein [Micromonospora noduli]RAN97599.1 Glucosylceramidase [Micromonospora noduli]
MGKSLLSGLATVVLTGGALVGTTLPAQADAPTTLYVRQNPVGGCSDQFPGTLAQPFCSIGAAAAVVTAGQTVDVGGGNYPERVTIPTSGTPEQPVTFFASDVATLIGATAGFVIDGQHDVVLKNLRSNGSTSVLPGLDLRNSSRITIQGGNFAMDASSTAPAVRLAGVTGSTLKQINASGPTLSAGIIIDAASSDVLVKSVNVLSSAGYRTTKNGVGVRVDGPRVSILDSKVSGFTGAAVTLGVGAVDTVVANNQIDGGSGHGVHNNGATGTAITNNTIKDRCRDGIRVDAASSGVAVQNNVLITNGFFDQSYCDPAFIDGVEIGVYGGAVGKTVVDYNNAHHYYSDSPQIYAWNTRMSLVAFRTASGQAAHDRETGQPRDNLDSANSAAPGFPALDRIGTSRMDDPAVANTGAGPITYADRGAVETIRPPAASFGVSMDLGARSVELDASASKPGLHPIESYRFEFGDGSGVTQSTPVASHTYANPGTYSVSVKVTGTDGRTDTSSQQVSVLRRTATVGLLALSNRRYVDGAGTPTGLVPTRPELGLTAQFDLTDAGGGQVALFSHVTGRYVSRTSNGGPGWLHAMSQVVAAPERFSLNRNSDGTTSLKADNGQYVTADPSGAVPLAATRPTISTWEKFHQVTVADANRTLKARVNGRYVSADGAGSKPLIANGPAVSLWERFDVVDLGNGQVALLARVNNHFVSADGAGAKPLIANGPTASSWERFTIVRNSDGTVSFKATINNKYVSADGAGSKPLIANGPAISTWEKLTLG